MSLARSAKDMFVWPLLAIGVIVCVLAESLGLVEDDDDDE